MNKKLISRLLLFALIFSVSSGSVFAAGEDLADETIAEISEQDEEDAEEEFAAPADDGVSDNYIANDETEPDEEGSDGSAEKTDDDVDSGEDSNDDPKGEFRTVILCKKVDLNSFFGEYKGEKKYELSNKKIGTVNKKGILTIKKAGDLDVYCFVKENGKWTKVDETYFAVDIPKAKMKTIPAGVVYREYQTLDLFKYITGNWGLEPGAWMIKADPEVATLDIKTGELRAGRKNGKAAFPGRESPD